MILHVVTALTRPGNLPALAESLRDHGHWELHWHIVPDFNHTSVGGQTVKNRIIDQIDNGWVWILDDDTTAYPGALETVYRLAAGDYDLVIVGQQRADGAILIAAPGHVGVGSVDVGQLFMRRDTVGELRLPDDYNGDGIFARELVARLDPNRVFYLNSRLSYHNALR